MLKISVFYFSMLAHLVLHTTLRLLPFGLRWRKTSNLLTLISGLIVHHIILDALALSNHAAKASRIGQHLVLIRSSYKIVGYWVFLLTLMIILILIMICISLICSLPFHINRRLGPNSIFSRGRAWFGRASSCLRNHLSLTITILLVFVDATLDEIVVLLSQTEWVRWWPINVVRIVLSEALGIWRCRSFLCSARTKTIAALAGSKTSLTSLVCLVVVGVYASRHSFPTHHLARILNSVVLIELIVECSSSDWSTWFENSELLLIQDLWVCEVLVRVGLKMWWPHYLLWHHQIILLRSINSFLALDCSYTKLRLL